MQPASSAETSVPLMSTAAHAAASLAAHDSATAVTGATYVHSPSPLSLTHEPSTGGSAAASAAVSVHVVPSGAVHASVTAST